MCYKISMAVFLSCVVQGFLTKERARQNFDGSLWPILAEENKQRKLGKQKRSKTAWAYVCHLYLDDSVSIGNWLRIENKIQDWFMLASWIRALFGAEVLWPHWAAETLLLSCRRTEAACSSKAVDSASLHSSVDVHFPLGLYCLLDLGLLCWV